MPPGGFHAGFQSTTALHNFAYRKGFPCNILRISPWILKPGIEATLPLYPKALRFASDEEAARAGHEGATKKSTGLDHKPSRFCSAYHRFRGGLAVVPAKLDLAPQKILEPAAVAPESSNQSSKSHY